MIFRIVRGDPSKPLLEGYRSQWEPAELELERYLLSTEEPDHLERDVFREKLLVVSNQVRTREAKRADILALDKYGNAVIVELKRHAGKLGVDTQALQYLADFSRFRGRAFIDHFSHRDPKLRENVAAAVTMVAATAVRIFRPVRSLRREA